MEDTRIGLVQMQSKLGAPEENLRKIKGFVKDAAGRQVSMLCFPELCLQGYSREKARVTAEPLPGHYTAEISRLARLHRVLVLVGLVEQGPPDRPYITQLVAYPDGQVACYRKTHLGQSEMPHFSPGDSLPVFNHEQACFGIEICWDLHFPEVSTILSLQGAEIIFAPHASPTIVGDRRGIWLKYLTARAYDNTVYVAACNQLGDNGDDHSFGGGSLVIDPKGNVVAEDFSRREGMLVADLAADPINRIRGRQSASMRHSFYLAGRRPELYRGYWDR